ncbi:GNAT family N-acetyltransferase [Xanthomonadaceae bacterium JHOS43]|nr:GNAT family N-acetyltransferase [Xanthomonadaceae bacterium JHOS43]MCX7564175.1 GNAT family N-acetyltransferase [Xanthomonadaceae bacterium XH05]
MATSHAETPDYFVRAATAADDDAILALCARFAQVPLPHFRQRTTYLAHVRRDIAADLEALPTGTVVLVAEDARGRCAGFARVRLVNDSIDGTRNAHLADLVVASAHEGKGTAQALLDAAEAFARAQHCTHLQLFTFPDHERALRLYRRSGFETDMLRLVKPLA